MPQYDEVSARWNGLVIEASRVTEYGSSSRNVAPWVDYEVTDVYVDDEEKWLFYCAKQNRIVDPHQEAAGHFDELEWEED